MGLKARTVKYKEILYQTFKDLVANNVLKLSAALAYYTVFSLPGLMIVVIWISDLFYGKDVVERALYDQVASFLGRSTAHDIQNTIQTASTSSGNKFITTVGLIALIVGATSVFGEIQDSINYIWKLKTKLKKGRGWLKLIIDRLISFSMILSLGFILLVSLLLNGIMDLGFTKLTSRFPELTVIIAYIVNLLITIVLVTLIFGLIFKVLPDAKIKWRHVRAGALTTALLFLLGKFLITYYLSHNQLSVVYGGAGSVIIILLWVYYSSIILYFGACFTRAYAVANGSNIFPNQYAVWVEQVEIQSKDVLPSA